MDKSGIAFLNQAFNPGNDYSNLNSSIDALDLKVIPAKVTDIILDNTHPNFSKNGGWNGIGMINFEKINTPDGRNQKKPLARPFFPQFKSYPLINEIVLLFYLPDTKIGESDSSKIYYYLNAINIWNHPHANPYQNIFESEFDLNGPNSSGGTFEEKENIHPILPYKGDNIFEGRYGNSIRLGNTARIKSLWKNNWSEKGEEGEPITIIRNGQSKDLSDEGWVHTIEDINKDISSFYLTSNQIIPIQAASTNYTGLEKPPIHPASYQGSQAIINADRILLNAKEDSILLSSKKSIAISSNEGVGLSSSGSISIESGELKLGSSVAEQPVILGDTFLKELNGVLAILMNVAKQLAAEPALKLTPAFATVLAESLKRYGDKADNFKSKTVKVL